MAKKQEEFDVVVVGGGPAGMTAALYAGRARLKTLLIEKSLMGGMATYTSEIENYPGFVEPSDGIELMKLFDKQMRRFGVQVKLTAVDDIAVDSCGIVVSTFRSDYLTKALVVATGNKPRLTGAKNEERFLNDKGISFCATCDAARNSGKRIMVIGSGDAAIEEGMFLTKFASEVIVSVIHDEGIMDANKVAQERAMANPKMTFVWNTVVESFEGDDMLRQVVLKNLKTGELIPFDVDGCFLFIGYVPNTQLVENLLDMSDRGYIKTNELMETNQPGIFAAGDCRDKMLRQVATAVGDGATAGFMAEKYVEEVDYVQKEIFGAEGLVMAFVYNAVEPLDREYLALVESAQRDLGDAVKLCRIDIYKSDRIACRLSYKRSPSILFLRNGEGLETLDEFTNLKESIEAIVAKYGA